MATELAALAGGPVQIAYGATGVEDAAALWAGYLGIGPFFVRHNIPVTDVAIDGRPASFDHSSAFGQWGSIMVELIAVHDPPALATAGLHHVAYFVESFDNASSELAAAGWPATLTATAGATRFAFHDARADLGHFVEIYEPNDQLRAFYAMVAESDW